MHWDRATLRARLAALKDGGARSSAVEDIQRMQQQLEAGTLTLSPPSGDIMPKGGPRKEVAIPTTFARAAVLVPLIEYAEGYSVLLTQRTDDLNKHAGQVAFPGGRMDPTDADEEACALREAREETGLDPAKVEIIGRLGEWSTGTGFHMTPVVGVVTPPLDLNPDPGEVAAVFEVPLAFFLDPANHGKAAIHYNGIGRAFYEMPYDGRYIWGATAAILVNLYYALTG
jgi:8-oxo-dGTP pyrophosphatase MutT (NUDIX family)